MVTVSPLLSSINSGEFSPRMEGRVDFDRYPNAAKMCRNFLLLPQGGIARRPGTRFVKEVKTSANSTKLLPFQFNQDQAYVIEAGDAYMRFYRRQARLDVANITAAITNGTFASNITGWTDTHTAAFVASSSQTNDAQTYTATGLSIGAASFGRTVVITIAAVDLASAGATISSVTIDGVAMTEIVQATQTNTDAAVAGIFALRWPAGTTANIVVTFSTTISRVLISSWTVRGSNPTRYDTASDNTISTDEVSGDIDVQNGGCIIAVAVGQDSTGAPSSASWTNGTEQFDTNPEGFSRFTGALVNATATEAPRSISVDFNGGADLAGALAMASWGRSDRISHDTGNSGQLKFTESVDGPASAVQAVTITETSTEHVLSFIIRGEGGATVDFQVGTTAGGNNVLEAIPCGVGYHAIAFTPGASTVYVQFHSQNSPVRVTYLDTVALLDNVPFEVTTPYATADLADLRFFQAADVMYLLHPSYVPRRLERRGHTTWSLVEAFFEDGPYDEINPGTDLTVSQLVVNPFFENGIKDWSASLAGDSTLTAEEGFNRVKLTSVADATVQIQQQIACETSREHVCHYLAFGPVFNGIDAFFLIGTSAGGTQIHSNLSARGRWTSVAFTPSQAAVHLTFGITDTEVSPYYLNAMLVYPASGKLMRVSATSGYVTVTAVGHDPFSSSDVGRLIRLTWPGHEPGYGVITAFGATNSITMLVLRKLAYANICTEKWQLGSWSAEAGYPQVIGFFGGRLVAAATTTAPQTLWFSQSDDLQNMRPDSWVEGAAEVEDDDAINVTLASRRINEVAWLSDQRELVVGTVGAQWIIGASGEVLTPADVAAKQHSATPAANVQCAESNQVALFLDRSRRELYEVGFNFDAQAFITTLLTILSDHVLRSPATALEYQRLPHSILWAPRADGRAATLSYNRQHEILGWSQQIMGGAFSSGDAVIESIAVIPGAEDVTQVLNSDDRDEVWMIVKRTVNGATKRYVEFLEKVFEGPLREDYSTEEDWRDAMVTAMKDAFYVDCGITYSGVSTATITGLSHLEGQTVKVLADGKVHPNCTVSSGSITLNYSVTKAQVGLAYTSRYESLKIAVQGQTGSAVHRVKAVTGISAVVLDSGSFKATSVDYDRYSGRRQHDLQEVSFRRDETQASTAAQPLVTGEVGISTETHYPPDARIYIESNLPLPLNILALVPEMKVTDARHTT